MDYSTMQLIKLLAGQSARSTGLRKVISSKDVNIS